MSTEAEITQIEQTINYNLPKLYREFLLNLEADQVYEINNSGVYLYSINDLIERNETYEVPEYEPDYFLIGQDGDLAFFIKKDNSELIFSNDLGAIGSLDMENESENINELIKNNS
ncbi:SMI1/KNR4 family protein [uncultured Zobellia sp.]|uniref:SMI1/KNR4 family protein n=1 Tax=uncultured Zobellia sp. TaxID=255433 RepID=UPI00259363BD|nr:SMI1/KNR4 family protein [uncultured Zobellia sp.]